MKRPASQWIQAPLMVLGWVVLIPFCLARAWKPCQSTVGTPRLIDRWSWGPLNSVYGNPEDGVSGDKALVWYWDDTLPRAIQIKYRFYTWPPLRAWLWSAWRNSTNQLARKA